MEEQKVYDDAALEQLWGQIPFVNGVLGDIRADETARIRAKIAAKREWVNGLSDKRWRKAFGKWLDHAEFCCAKADRYREERPAKDAAWEQSENARREIRLKSRDLLRSNPPA